MEIARNKTSMLYLISCKPSSYINRLYEQPIEAQLPSWLKYLPKEGNCLKRAWVQPMPFQFVSIKWFLTLRILQTFNYETEMFCLFSCHKKLRRPLVVWQNCSDCQTRIGGQKLSNEFYYTTITNLPHFCPFIVSFICPETYCKRLIIEICSQTLSVFLVRLTILC